MDKSINTKKISLELHLYGAFIDGMMRLHKIRDGRYKTLLNGHPFEFNEAFCQFLQDEGQRYAQDNISVYCEFDNNEVKMMKKKNRRQLERDINKINKYIYINKYLYLELRERHK